MSSVTFKCPTCGAYLAFDPEKQAFVCPYCGASFTEADLADKSAAAQAAGEQAAREEAAQPEGHAHTDAAGRPTNAAVYSCKNCGAEIVAEESTAATFCFYCHSPVVLTDRLASDFKPDRVIPFAIDKDEAQKRFLDFVKKKKYVPNGFFSKAQLTYMAGVYAPYWMADYDADATFTGEGRQVTVSTEPKYIVTTTRHYRVMRRGALHFAEVMRVALKKNNRKLYDGIHPFKLADARPFSMPYLSGFMADKRDMTEDDVSPDVEAELQTYVQSRLTRGAHYDQLTGSTQTRFTAHKYEYLLLPTWVLTYKAQQEKDPYYYVMNGQTGAVCGRLPISGGKLLRHCLLIGGAVFAILCLGGYFLW